MYIGPQLGTPQKDHPDYEDPALIVAKLNSVEEETSLTEVDLISMSDLEIREMNQRTKREIEKAEHNILKIRELSDSAIRRILESCRTKEVIQEMAKECARVGIRFRALLLFLNGDPIVPQGDDLKFIVADILCSHVRAHVVKEATIEALEAQIPGRS